MHKLKESRLIIKQLHAMQHELDELIDRSNHITLTMDERLKRLTVALYVEIGELANEIQSFKFWKKHKNIKREKELEEYIDGLHFILSIGNHLGLVACYEDHGKEIIDVNEKLLEVYGAVYLLTHFLSPSTREVAYRSLYSRYIELGELLGFDDEDVLEGYRKKMAVNIDRQHTGY